MTQARLLVSIPDGQWKADVSRRHPDATFRVLAAVLDSETGFEHVVVSGPTAADCVSAISAHPAVGECSIVQRAGDDVTIQVEATAPAILQAAKESRLPIEFPMEVHDGRAAVDVTGLHDRLAALGERFRGVDPDFEVAYIQSDHRTTQLLTETQRELLFEAIERGYYETPRRCILTELADGVGLAKSTCSETLHRIEGAIVEYFVEESPAVTNTEERLVVT